MNAIVAVLEPVARAAVATLFNSLWEATLLAIAVWAVLHFVPNLNAATRYAAWCVALAAAIVLPLATTLPRITLQPAVVYERLPQSSTRQAPSSAATLRTMHAHSASSAAHLERTPPAPSAGFRFPQRAHVAVPSIAALAIFAAWLLVALAILGRLILNLVRLERLKRDALPLPVDYREHLQRWADAAKGTREVRLCVSDRIEVPIAVGLFDSMILIPQHLLQTLSENEVDQITLHELGHLRRADDWTNAFQRIVQALFFFNPAILWIAQQLDLEREVACDDWVLATTRDVRPYAFCLTKMAEVTAWPHRALAAPGVFMTRKSLSIRVERLLRAGRNVRTGIAFGPTGAVAAALIVLFFVLQSVAPSIAFTLPAQAVAPVPAVIPIHVAHHIAHATVAVQPAPTAAAKPVVTPKPRVRVETRTEYRYITVPATHVHVPARNVHVPEVNVNIPKRTFRVLTAPRVGELPRFNPLPVNFEKNLKIQIIRSFGNMGTRTGGPHLTGDGCTGCDMTGANLAGHDFRNKSYLGSDFTRANLQNADFRGASLTGVDFHNANLRGANFTNAQMEGCNFRGADLTNATLDGARMTGCDFDVARLTPTQARAVLRGCEGCDFKHADLHGQDMHGISIEGDDMAYADLRGADLSNVQFTGIDLHGAQLAGAKLDGASFTGCDFSGVNLHDVDLSRAHVVGSKFTGSHAP
jgi:uncharacterized protein YjbI with pentapeptide repeats/beta-lactamase regulating signal transducer with metallopeptidase domain